MDLKSRLRVTSLDRGGRFDRPQRLLFAAGSEKTSSGQGIATDARLVVDRTVYDVVTFAKWRLR